jgi:hypothetical protein
MTKLLYVYYIIFIVFFRSPSEHNFAYRLFLWYFVFFLCVDTYLPNVYTNEVRVHVLCILCCCNGLDQYFQLTVTHLNAIRRIWNNSSELVNICPWQILYSSSFHTTWPKKFNRILLMKYKRLDQISWQKYEFPLNSKMKQSSYIPS